MKLYVEEKKVLKKLLKSQRVPQGRVIEECLVEWNIEDILTLTVDNASSNDLAIDYLKRNTKWKRSILDNRFLHVRCCAHIVNLIVKDGLNEQSKCIVRIRNAIKYVRSDTPSPTIQDYEVDELGDVKLIKSGFDKHLEQNENVEPRDVLATPVSTIASEQAFSTSGRLLDPYRSSLDPKTVEALVCAQSWLCSRPINIEEAIGEIEKYEEMHEEFMTASSSITHDLDD
ncbi:Zinc finger BED domain-containing protein RICESLEEPER 3 [Sesamum angolense]|uniref:Zinc finger BED domain-containing protein RICESLEEPER 3 n=1 Tax=Sesamum angolense TaxID=2727404 RepID=A0AAE1T9U9_9LAMI|nr:Zinc finger BED domain-containing protein RICESLEEPER 3 [Sesamum angolense]